MTTIESDFSFEISDSGKRIPALEIVGKGKPLTVTELRDFLDDLIEEGYGDYKVEGDTDSGASCSIYDEVRVLRRAKTVIIY